MHVLEFCPQMIWNVLDINDALLWWEGDNMTIAKPKGPAAFGVARGFLHGPRGLARMFERDRRRRR